MKEKETNQRLYRMVFEELTIPSFILDTDYSILEVNKAMCDLLDYSITQLKQIDFKAWFADIDGFDQVIEHLKDNESNDLKLKLKDSSGSVIRCMLSIKRIEEESKEGSPAFLGTVQKLMSISDKEQELLFDESLRTCKRIVRSMGHEIRNPLTNLTLALDQLSEEIVNIEDNRLYFDIINRNATRIEKLISDVLALTRLDEVYLYEDNINLLIKKWTEDIKTKALGQCITFEMQLSEGLPTRQVDVEKLQIAFRNIVINALKAIGKKENGIIKIITYAKENDVIISVEDNGVGISEEHIDNIFSPFVSGDGKWGIGLGLTQARNIINAHEGLISVESQLGVGSKFSIVLKK